jgi:hypothetical protein
MPATRKTLRGFVAPPAPTRETYAGFTVGQQVFVKRNADTTAASFTGVIRKIVVPPLGWKFALVEDGGGGHHAVDFSEMV